MSAAINHAHRSLMSQHRCIISIQLDRHLGGHIRPRNGQPMNDPNPSTQPRTLRGDSVSHALIALHGQIRRKCKQLVIHVSITKLMQSPHLICFLGSAKLVLSQKLRMRETA